MPLKNNKAGKKLHRSCMRFRGETRKEILIHFLSKRFRMRKEKKKNLLEREKRKAGVRKKKSMHLKQIATVRRKKLEKDREVCLGTWGKRARIGKGASFYWGIKMRKRSPSGTL